MAIKNMMEKPIQEIGSSNANVKVGSGGSSLEKSSVIEQLEILDYKEETTPVQENNGMPEKQDAPMGLKAGPEVEKESDIKVTSTQTLSEEYEQVPPGQHVKDKKKKTRPKKKRSSKGRKEAKPIPSNVEEGRLPITKVNAGTQTEPELSEHGADPHREEESDIKEMSTQTPEGEHDQLPPGQGVKKKKTRRKKKRPSKVKEEANWTPSCDDGTQSASTSLQLPAMSGYMKNLPCVVVLALFCCYVGVTQGFPMAGKVHVYYFNSQRNLSGTTVTIKKGLSPLCDIQVNLLVKNECGDSSVLLKDSNTLILFSNVSSDFFLEAGGDRALRPNHTDQFDDVESALKSIEAKEDQTPFDAPTESPHTGHATNEMPWWLILIIALIVGIAIGGTLMLLYKLRQRILNLCKMSTLPRPPSPPPTELEHLRSSSDRNGP